MIAKMERAGFFSLVLRFQNGLIVKEIDKNKQEDYNECSIICCSLFPFKTVLENF
jgi:hypothetical protein